MQSQEGHIKEKKILSFLSNCSWITGSFVCLVQHFLVVFGELDKYGGLGSQQDIPEFNRSLGGNASANYNH